MSSKRGNTDGRFSKPSEVKVTRKRLSDVKTMRRQIIHYKDEGYYVLLIHPDFVLEAELHYGDDVRYRYYAVGYKVDYYTADIQKALVKLNTLRDADKSNIVYSLVYLPKRIFAKLKEFIELDPTMPIAFILQAQGNGRGRTYSIIQAMHVDAPKPTEEDLKDLTDAFQNFVSKVNSKEGDEE